MIGAILDAAKWVVPAVASIWGAHSANSANKKEAEKNRQFQENMSNTAAQRGVADYASAGLNPALAYDKGATTPGGSTATMSNEVEGAVSGARQYKQWKDQLELQKAQQLSQLKTDEVNRKLMAVQGGTQLAQANLLDAQRASEVQKFAYNTETQVPMLAQLKAQALMTQLGIPAMKNTADWEQFISGTPNKLLRGVGEVGKFIPKFKF